MTTSHIASTLRHLPLALRALAQGASELLLPGSCAACRALTDGDDPLCALCARTLDPIAWPCPRCGLPLPKAADPPLTDGQAAPRAACLACQRRPPPWHTARAPFAYAGDLAVAIRRFKLAREVALARPLARLLAPTLDEAAAHADAFIPVPLHPARLRDREFNHASLLARGARRRGQPPVVEALDRVRDTPPQGTLDAARRRANVRGAFAVGKSHRAAVRGATVCLVDDVLTTGATAAACAEALLRAGAARVDVITLARTPP